MTHRSTLLNGRSQGTQLTVLPGESDVKQNTIYIFNLYVMVDFASESPQVTSSFAALWSDPKVPLCTAPGQSGAGCGSNSPMWQDKNQE